MKKSELRQIIKEEIESILEANLASGGFKGSTRMGKFKNEFSLETPERDILNKFSKKIAFGKIPFTIDNNDRNVMYFKATGKANKDYPYYEDQPLENHIFTRIYKGNIIRSDMDKPKFMAFIKKYS